jgi:hypothetical protein
MTLCCIMVYIGWGNLVRCLVWMYKCCTIDDHIFITHQVTGRILKKNKKKNK